MRMDSDDKFALGLIGGVILLAVVSISVAAKEDRARKASVKACREVAIRATCLHPEEKAAILDVCR